MGPPPPPPPQSFCHLLYSEHVTVRDALSKANDRMIEEKKQMLTRIEAEQGDLSTFQKDLVDATRSKDTKEEELNNVLKNLKGIEQQKKEMEDKRRKFESELGNVRNDLEDMEMAITKAEQEKTNRDHMIRNMNDEVAHQDELI